MTGGTSAVASLPAIAIGSKRRRALAVKAMTSAGLAGGERLHLGVLDGLDGHV